MPGADVPARIRTRPGGAGANTAAWLAHLGRDAGIAVTLAARVGADPAGRAAAAELAAAGVTAHLAVDPEAATCTVVALLGPPGRLEASHRARPHLSRRDLARRVPRGAVPPAATPSGAGRACVRRCGRAAGRPGTARCCPTGARPPSSARTTCPTSPGSTTCTSPATCCSTPRRGPRGGPRWPPPGPPGITTSVDPQAAPALAAPGRAAAFLDDVRGVDLLLPNADELRALGGAAAVLRQVRAVAVSAGADGRELGGPDRRLARRRRARVTVVDATGAGDAFDAGVLVAWLSGASPAEALAAGCSAGAAAVGRLGARP